MIAIAVTVAGCAGAAAPGAAGAPSPSPSPSPDDDAACVAGPDDATAAGDACSADADCLVTNFPGCCACPQCSTADPIARSRAAAATAEAACAAASCDASVCAIAGMCPPGEPAAHFTPRCCAGVCVGRRAI